MLQVAKLRSWIASSMVHVCAFAATRRGLAFINKLHSILPHANFTFISFKEDEREPPFFKEIESFSADIGATFLCARNVALEKYHSFWNSLESVDLMFCVSWRYLIPPEVYERARLGAFVFHDSKLPKYRGFAPTVWAIINGESYTGATMISISEGIDEGDIVDQEAVEILQTDTIAHVLVKVTNSYLAILERNIYSLLSGTFTSAPQDHSEATYTVKRTQDDYKIDWTKPARFCHNLIRGCTKPYPGAYTLLDGKKCIIWKADLRDSRVFEVYAPGRVVSKCEEGISVLCGDKCILHCSEIELHTESCETLTLAEARHKLLLSSNFHS